MLTMNVNILVQTDLSLFITLPNTMGGTVTIASVIPFQMDDVTYLLQVNDGW